MEEILETMTSREAFDEYWEKNYVPLLYEDVQEAFEAFVKECEGKIYIEDFPAGEITDPAERIANLHEDAQFAFQDAMTEAFYDKNPEVYETAFALFTEAQMEGRTDEIALTFHETFARLYREFMERLLAD